MERSFEIFGDFYQYAHDHELAFYRASIDWFDYGENVFRKGWTFKRGKWIKVDHSIRPDVIYDKTAGRHDHDFFGRKMKILQKIPIMNHPLFRIAVGNKFSQYLLLGEHMPETVLINSKEDFPMQLRKIRGNLVVVKPIYGSGGEGIFIGEKSEAIKKQWNYPVIAQEFIKSTKGIPGLSSGDEVADLRLVYTDHKLIYALSRIAKEGSLFTNFHQGAIAKPVPKNKIPKELRGVAEQIVKKLSVFPVAHYSLDFIFSDDGRVLLVEMNTSPGFGVLRIIGDRQAEIRYFDSVVKSIKRVLCK